MNNKILVADEVAKILRIDRPRVYELVRYHRIPVIRLGKRQYRFSAEAIERWLEGGGANSGGPIDGPNSDHERPVDNLSRHDGAKTR